MRNNFSSILDSIEDDYSATEIMWQNMRDMEDILDESEDIKSGYTYQIK